MHVLQRLTDAAGPADLDRLNSDLRSQAEMHPLIARRKITARRCDRSVLRPLGRNQLDGCPNGIPVTLMAHQVESQPVILRLSLVVNYVSRSVISRHNRVDAAVVVEIAGSQAAACPCLVEDVTRLGGNIHKTMT